MEPLSPAWGDGLAEILRRMHNRVFEKKPEPMEVGHTDMTSLATSLRVMTSKVRELEERLEALEQAPSSR